MHGYLNSNSEPNICGYIVHADIQGYFKMIARSNVTVIIILGTFIRQFVLIQEQKYVRL